MEGADTTNTPSQMGVLNLHATVITKLIEELELQKKDAGKLVDDLKSSKAETEQTKKEIEKLVDDLRRSKQEIDQTKKDLKRVDHFMIGFVIVIGLAFIGTVVVLVFDYVHGQQSYDYYLNQVMDLNNRLNEEYIELNEVKNQIKNLELKK